MSDDTRRVLDLLAQGKITVDQAADLLRALGERGTTAPPPRTKDERPRYVRIAIAKAANGWRPEKQINIRVPIALVQSGIRLGAVFPGLASEEILRRLRERGIDIDLTKLDQVRIEDILANVGEVDLDIDAGKAKIHITSE
jgi:hypothetical protein